MYARKIIDFKFQRKRLNEIPQAKILAELEKAAEHFHYIEFGHREFSKIAGISGGLVKKRFGGWKKGLEALRLCKLITASLLGFFPIAKWVENGAVIVLRDLRKHLQKGIGLIPSSSCA